MACTMMTTGMRRLLSVCVFAQQASPVFMRISRNERRHADFCVQIVLGYCDIIVSGSHCHSEEAQPKKMCASPALLPPGARSRRVASECTGPSDSLHASTRAGPSRTLSYNGFILNDFEMENADVCAESSTSNLSKLDPKEGMPRILSPNNSPLNYNLHLKFTSK
jgi:hypothetical protein